MAKKENKVAENPTQKRVDSDLEYVAKVEAINKRQADQVKAEARVEGEARGMHRDYAKFEEERVAQVEANAKFEANQVQERVPGATKGEKLEAELKEYNASNFNNNSNDVTPPQPLSTEANEDGGLELAKKKSLRAKKV